MLQQTWWTKHIFMTLEKDNAVKQFIPGWPQLCNQLSTHYGAYGSSSTLHTEVAQSWFIALMLLIHRRCSLNHLVCLRVEAQSRTLSSLCEPANRASNTVCSVMREILLKYLNLFNALQLWGEWALQKRRVVFVANHWPCRFQVKDATKRNGNNVQQLSCLTVLWEDTASSFSLHADNLRKRTWGFSQVVHISSFYPSNKKQLLYPLFQCLVYYSHRLAHEMACFLTEPSISTVSVLKLSHLIFECTFLSNASELLCWPKSTFSETNLHRAM